MYLVTFHRCFCLCRREIHLVQLVDALLHAADGGHGSQSVSVEVSEAVLPADLKQGDHRSFLEEDQVT